jgi:hypothetical protein
VGKIKKEDGLNMQEFDWNRTLSSTNAGEKIAWNALLTN